jgi:hypothetical protein
VLARQLLCHPQGLFVSLPTPALVNTWLARKYIMASLARHTAVTLSPVLGFSAPQAQLPSPPQPPARQLRNRDSNLSHQALIPASASPPLRPRRRGQDPWEEAAGERSFLQLRLEGDRGQRPQGPQKLQVFLSQTYSLPRPTKGPHTGKCNRHGSEQRAMFPPRSLHLPTRWPGAHPPPAPCSHLCHGSDFIALDTDSPK